MNDEIREQLSALADDELSDLERPLLLSRLERDEELKDCLGRYRLIGEAMRGAGRLASLSIAGRVQQALEHDGSPAGAGKTAPAMNWWKPVAGLAVAASVALVAVMTVSSLRQSDDAPVPEMASAETTPTVTVTAGDEQWDRIEPRIDKRLSGYLVNHNEYAASRGVQGVMPYVRIVGHQNDR